MNRSLFLSFALVVVLAFGTVAAAEPVPPARLFPADTFAYVEADADALMAGLANLDLARLIGDPEVRASLRPAFEKMGIDPEKPVASMLGRLPVKAWVDGRVAIGMRGFVIVTHRPDGTSTRTVVSPSNPLQATLVHEVLGAFAVAELAKGLGQGRQPAKIEVHPDMLAVVEPGPQLRAIVDQQLENAAGFIKRETVEIGGKKVLRVSWEERVDRDVILPFQVYADLTGDRWILGTDEKSFAAALAGGPEKSLGVTEGFLSVRDRLSGKGRTLFAFVDVERVLDMVSTAIPPLLAQHAEIVGLTSLRGVGAAITMTHGGVRESFAILFDGRPRGIFSLLDAMPGGFTTTAIAPESTLGFVGMKLDLAKLHERAKALTGKLIPGVEHYVDPLLTNVGNQIGIDLLGDLLPALGDEMSIMVFPPRGGFLPEAVMLMKLRDPEKFAKVIAVAKEHLARMGLSVRELPLTDGDPGFWLHSREIPVQPSFAVRNGYLVGAMGPSQLRGFLRQWKKATPETPTLAGDEIYKKVMDALGAGDGKRLAVLGYVNLRRGVPPALNTAMPFAGAVPDLADWIDLAMVPEGQVVGDYLSGIAFAVQRDGNAISLDFFSPTGITPLAVWVMYEQQQQARRQAFMRRFEEEQRREEAALRARMANDPFIGFFFDQDQPQVVLTSIIAGTPAEKAGLKAGDVLITLGDASIGGYPSFRSALMKHKPGDRVALTVKRGQTTIVLEVVLGRRGDFDK